MSSAVATAESLLVGAEEAARLCGVSRSTFLRLDRRGLLGPRSIKLGAKLVRWRRDELENWVDGGCRPRCEFLRAYGEMKGSPATVGESASKAPSTRTTHGRQIRGLHNG